MNKHNEEMESKKVDVDMEDESVDSCCEKESYCKDDCCSEDISVKEIAYHADDKVDALIQLLIKKGVIKDSEFEEEYNSLFEEEEE
jgi:hypothetical protein